MLLERPRQTCASTSERSWMIGDTDGDCWPGRAAGCRTVLIEHRDSAHKRTAQLRPTPWCSDLTAAVRIILAEEASKLSRGDR